MLKLLDKLPDDITALKVLVTEQAALANRLQSEKDAAQLQIVRLDAKVLSLQEQLNLALARRYAASSEKLSPDQIRLFDEAEVDAQTASIKEDADVAIKVGTHTRNKRGRKPLPDTLPRTEVIYALAGDDLNCPRWPGAERHWGDHVGATGHRAGHHPGDPPYPQAVRLRLRPVYPHGSLTGTTHPQEPGLPGLARAHHRLQIPGRSAAVPPGDHSAAYWRGQPPGHARKLDDPGWPAGAAPDQPAAGPVVGR